ncbi:MAG TPA: hypothetical protein VMW83_04525 [Spirochaetia bacterium]|nr:hypothetical protein [Spirochaetia bacterium]
MKNRRLGDILLEAGLINHQQLGKALAVQAGSQKRLGEILLDLGFVTEQLMATVLEFQLGTLRVPLREWGINPSVVNILPRHLAEKHLVFPLNKKEDKILVAMADPLDYLAIEEIQAATGLRAEVYLTTRSEVEEAIQRYYALPAGGGRGSGGSGPG